VGAAIGSVFGFWKPSLSPYARVCRGLAFSLSSTCLFPCCFPSGGQSGASPRGFLFPPGPPWPHVRQASSKSIRNRWTLNLLESFIRKNLASAIWTTSPPAFVGIESPPAWPAISGPLNSATLFLIPQPSVDHPPSRRKITKLRSASEIENRQLILLFFADLGSHAYGTPPDNAIDNNLACRLMGPPDSFCLFLYAPTIVYLVPKSDPPSSPSPNAERPLLQGTVFFYPASICRVFPFLCKAR